MHPVSKGFMIATAVATMAIGGSLQAMAQDKAQSEPVGRAGLNAQGQGSCKASGNDCKGRTPAGKSLSRQRPRRSAPEGRDPEEVGPVWRSRCRTLTASFRDRRISAALDGTARVDWFEAISENAMIAGGRPLAAPERARALASWCPRRVAVHRLHRSA
jgi:hypothetical protein